MLELNVENFDELVVKSNKPVLVDFWAEWCGPCKALSPILEEVSKTSEDMVFAKVNVDDHAALAQEYGIRGIPTMLIFEKGNVVKTVVGNQPKSVVEDLVKEFS